VLGSSRARTKIRPAGAGRIRALVLRAVAASSDSPPNLVYGIVFATEANDDPVT
jgi:hypothetical protein